MSNTVDNRVVQMEFNNKDFEKNASKTIKTLDKLDDALKLKNGAKSFKDVEEAAAKVNFEPLKQAVEETKSKIDVLAMSANWAVKNVVDSLMNMGKKLLKSVTIDPIAEGFSKYEEKTASVQTLMNSTGLTIDEVNGYLNKLMTFSDETSYSFTQMTSALSTMTSAGGDIETLIPMLEGVANATAFAGKSAREFSGAIFNLNQSYAGGYLSYTDFNSLDRTYNMFSKQLKQAFIDCAKAAGTLDEEGRTAGGTLVTISNFAQTLSEKWADRTVMENAFGYFAEMTEQAYELVNSGVYDTYTEAYDAIADDFDDVQAAAAKSAQEAKTFKEAIDATKDAVSSGFMETFELLFGNYQEAKELWSDLANSMYEIFAEPGNKRNEILTEALTSKWIELNTELTNAGINEDTFREKLITTGKAHNLVTDEEIESLGTLEEIMKSDWMSGRSDLIAETLRNYTTTTVAQSVEEQIAEANTIAKEILQGKWGNGTERVNALTEAGYDYAKMQSYAEQLHATGSVTVNELSEAQSENIDVTDEQREAIEALADELDDESSSLSQLIQGLSDTSGRMKLIQGVKNILSSIVTTLKQAKLGFGEVFGGITAQNVSDFIDGFLDFSNTLTISETSAENLKNGFAGVASVFKVVFSAVKGIAKIFTPAIQVLTNLASAGTAVFGTIGKGLKSLLTPAADAVDHCFEPIHSVFTRIWGVAGAAIHVVKEFFEVLGERIPATDIFSNLRENIQSLVSGKLSKLNGYLDKLKGKLQKINKVNIRTWMNKLSRSASELQSRFLDIWTAVKTRFYPVISSIRDTFSSVIGYITETAWPAVKNFFSDIANSKKPLDTLWEKIKDIGKAIKNFLGLDDLTIWGETAKEVFGTVKDAVHDFVESVKGYVSGIDLTSLISVAAIAGVTATVVNANKALSGVGTLTKSIADFVTTIKKRITPVTPTIVTNLTKLVKTIVVLAAAVLLLSFQDQGKVWSAVGVVAVLTVCVACIGKFMRSISSGVTEADLAKMSGMIINIAATVKVLAKLALIVGLLSLFDESKLATATLVLVVLAGAMIGICAALGKLTKRFDSTSVLGGEKFKMAATQLIKIAGSLVLLAAAVYIISMIKIDSVKSVLPTLEVLGILLGGMVVALLILGYLSKPIAVAAASILAVAASVFLMIFAMQLLAKNFELFESDVQVTSSFIVSFIAVLGSFMLLSAASKYLLMPIGKTLITLAVAVGLLVVDMFLVAKAFQYMITVSESLKETKFGIILGAVVMMVGFAAILAVLVIAIGIATRIAESGGKNAVKLGVATILMSVAILLMVSALKTIATYTNELKNSGAVAGAAVIVVAFAAICGAVMIAAGYAAQLGGGKGIVYMIGILGLIVAFVVACYALQYVETDDIRSMAWSMVLAMAAVAILFLAVAKASQWAKDCMSGAKALAMAAIPLAVAFGGLYAVATVAKGLEWYTLILAAVAVAGIMLAMAVAAKIAKDSFKGGAAIALASAAFISIAAAMWILAQVPSEKVLSVAITLGIAMVALVGVVYLLGAIKSISITGSVVMAIIAAALLVLAGAFWVAVQAMQAMQSLDFATIANGALEMAGPLSLLGLAGVALIAGSVGLLLASVALLALGTAFALVATSAYTLASGLLYAKGAWDFLKTGSTETWDLAVQMDAEAYAIRDSADNVTKEIDAATEEINASVENQNGTLAESMETSGAEVAAAAETAGENASSTAEKAWNWIKEQGGNLAGSLGDQFAAFKDNAMSGFDATTIENMAASYSNGDYAAMQDAIINSTSGIGSSVSVSGTETASTFAEEFVAELTNRSDSFTTSGEEIGNAVNAGAQSVDTAPSGVYFVQGLIRGIAETMSDLTTAVTQLAQSALDCVNITWQVNSPSKETMWSAKHFVNGMVVGIKANEKYAIYAVESMAENTLDTLNAALDADDVDTAIQPVLDMSDIMAQMDMLGENGEWQPVIHPTLDMSGVNPGLSNLHAIQSYRSVGSKADSVTATDAAADSAVTFNQYNYSPKALSRFEIYRQTQNQISFIGKVKAR